MKQPKFFGSTTMGERGQVVIPMEARESLEIEKGDKLLVMGMRDGVISLMKLSCFQKISEEMAQKQKEINEMIKDL